LETQDSQAKQHAKGSLLEILAVSLRLGLTSFGGPVAHLGYFREEYVKRRQWLDDRSFADLVALCQFLPGPASSQVGISIGMMRGGILGGITSWLGFTLPSAIALAIFAYVLQGYDVQSAGWLHGLMIAAVAVVAQAVWGMARTLAPDKPRGTMAILAALVTLLWPSAIGQVALIAAAGIVGWLWLPKADAALDMPKIHFTFGRRTAIFAWIAFFALLIGLPLWRQADPTYWLSVFDSFFRTGSLVFGGGHVVLPLLQAEVVPTGWVTDSQFLAGYGAAQAVPGPLFTFSSYLGTVMHGWRGAIVALCGIFLPSFLLLLGTLPFWDAIRSKPGFQAALRGINAAVVGLLLAAFYNPVFVNAVLSPADFCLAIVAFGMLLLWKLPPWVVVLVSALGGALIGFF
jgi:chromate transporter